MLVEVLWVVKWRGKCRKRVGKTFEKHIDRRMKTSVFLFVMMLLALTTVINAQQQGYSNPVVAGFYPDPSVCRVGDDYYLVTSTFEYFPGVPVFHSKDLIHWTQIGHCLTRASQLPLANCAASGGIYAPTIRYHKGLFYMTTTHVTGGGNFYVTAKDPAGEWSDPVYVKQGGIDPTIFFDGDKTYFLSTADGITMSEMDLSTGQLTGLPRVIWRGTGGRYPEGPHLYKKDGYYYLLIAEGGTEYGHKVTIARSRSIWGPYEGNPANPILTHINENAQNNPIQGVGHADLIEAHDGSWWMVHLGFRIQSGLHHLLGRETFLAPVRWDVNAWPVVNGNGTNSLTMGCQTLPQVAVPLAPQRLDFTEPKLPLEWTYLRNPEMSSYQLMAQQGILRLKGSAATIDETKSPTFVGRRQQHIRFAATTLLKEWKIGKGRGGVTVYMNNTSHYDLYVTQKGGKSYLEVRCRLGNIDQIVKSVAVSRKPIALKVEGSEGDYTFSYAQDEQSFVTLTKLDTKYLSSETTGGFTGIFLALFAEGEGAQLDVDAFTYTDLNK
jgi:xylan 1,4-beta-xylosidase